MDQLMEYDILKKIPFHKNIIPLHNLYLFTRTPEKVMPVIQYELAECSLENEIRLRKVPGQQFKPEECLKIMTDLAEGLSYIHSYKVFHLDIKPLNILKSFRGDYMLADFGQSMIFRS